MEEIKIIGVDIAKHAFKIYEARADGSVALSKKLSRTKLLPFLGSQPRCVVCDRSLCRLVGQKGRAEHVAIERFAARLESGVGTHTGSP